MSSLYALRDSRISKENICMVIALWMEDFPVERVEVEPYKRVGAVLVLPNDMIYAVDCSRNGVHGVARLLMAHPEILQDCKVFVSRKPCSLCAKLLVQSKVKRVFFLPIEPEYRETKSFEDETSRVDNLFKVSEISQTVFVPTAGKVLANREEKKPTPENITKKRDAKKEELLGLYWKEDWMASAKDNLPWPAFDDNMKTQVRDDFKGVMEWMATILVEENEDSVFKAVKALPAQPNLEGNDERKAEGNDKENDKEKVKALPAHKEIPFNPEGNDKENEAQQAKRLITVAKFLAERTDDPVTGVGAVIINKEKDIVGLGWNGFPTKALYGEFPRASIKDEATQDKKYPYIIHAEQNALLMRNTKNITGGTLFVTKTPCNDCTPLIEMQGIKTVVLGEKMQEQTNVNISYTEFPKKVNENVFICFEMVP